MYVSLLSDHALVIECDDDLGLLVRAWVPSHATALTPDQRVRAGATIHVRRGHAAPSEPTAREPTLTLAGVTATFTSPDEVRLVAPGGSIAVLDLGALAAHVVLPSKDARTAADLGTILTIASALLLNRLGAALVHAGAVVDSGGRAWAIAGDTHAGKTTTCITLVSAGWRYLADDQVVVRRMVGRDAILVEGWPRTAHVDGGWSGGHVTSVRGDLDMRARWPGQWISSAPLGGVILPNVQADMPTLVTPVTSGASLAGVIRQSPWLMADAAAAPAVLSLLSAAAALPAYALRHGLDTYGNGPALRTLVEQTLGAASP